MLSNEHLHTGLIAFAIWLMFVTPAVTDTSIRLDPSWQRALDVLTTRGDRAGVDYVFTYGPLGALGAWIELPHSFWSRWLLLEGLLFATAAWFGARALRGAGWVPHAAMLLTLSLFSSAGDLRALLAMACIAAALVARQRAFGFELSSGLLALVGFGLIKFSWQVLGCVLVVIVALDAAARRPRHAAGLVLVLYVTLYALGWMLAGQALGDLDDYWRNSFEIARGYSTAMAKESPGESLVVPVALLSLLFAAIALELRVGNAARESWARGAVCCATALMAFKAGSVSWSSIVIFVASALGVSALASTRWRTPQRAFGFLRLAVVAALFGVGLAWRPDAWAFASRAPHRFIEHARDTLLAYATLAERRASQRASEDELRDRLDCPRISAEIGTQPIDVLGIAQGLATINGWNYRPRPVFQSYAAYTPALLDLNAAYFASPAAPPFALLQLNVFAQQPPLGTDAAALEGVLAHYRPVLVERGFVLMRRDSELERPPSARELVLDRPLARGEWLELANASEKLRRVRIDFASTPAGTLRSLLLRGAVPTLEVRAEGGLMHTFRMVPGAASWGWLLDPLVNSQLDLYGWMCGERVPRAAALRWTVDEDLAGFLERDARLRIELVDDPFRLRPADREQFAFPMLGSPPSEKRGNFWVLPRDDDEWLASHSPAALEWHVGAGHSRLEGMLAVPSTALRSDGTQRLQVRIATRDAEGVETVVAERELTPTGARQNLRLAVPVHCETPATVIVEVTLAVAERASEDYVLWRGVGPRARSEDDRPRQESARGKRR